MSDSLRILWLQLGPLHPLDTGGKLRTYNMLRELSRMHWITYVALWPSDANSEAKTAAAQYAQDQVWIPWLSAPRGSLRSLWKVGTNLFSPLPFSPHKYRSLKMANAIHRQDADLKHDLIICDFVTPAVNLFSHPSQSLITPALLFEHNVEFQIWQRLAENSSNPLRRWYFQEQWRRMRFFEGSTAARFNSVVCVSQEDCALLRKEFDLKNVAGSVPTGVNLDYFSELVQSPTPFTIAFLGSMDWIPNIDAVMWFGRDILPAIKKRRPRVRFLIIGRNPPPQVLAMATESSDVEVTGTVPDVRPFLVQAETMVVPLRIGGGTRIKIFEAMAAGIPVVSTKLGAEGLEVTSGENILLADDPTDFANKTCLLLEKPELRNRIGEAGRNLVKTKFGWTTVANIFSEHCTKTARQARTAA
jgi:glycosyltransferase involved in cell wall biosynthesis